MGQDFKYAGVTIDTFLKVSETKVMKIKNKYR